MNCTKSNGKKIIRITASILLLLCIVWWIIMVCLGEETVLGNPILTTIWNIWPKLVIFGFLPFRLIVELICWLCEKKHLPKEEDPPLTDGDQHPSTD